MASTRECGMLRDSASLDPGQDPAGEGIAILLEHHHVAVAFDSTLPAQGLFSKWKVPPTGGQRPATHAAVKLNHVLPSQADASRGNEGASSRADVGAWSRRQP